MFKRFVHHVKVDFNIGVNLIEIGNTTWQTKNVTSVSVDNKVAKLGIVEPSMQTPKPRREFHLAILATSLPLVWTFAFTLDKQAVLAGFGLTLVLIALVNGLAHYAYKTRTRKWNVENEKASGRKKIWSELKKSPPTFYSLYIDSSNGKGLALVSLDIEPVNKVKKTILDRMQGVAAPDEQGHIYVVDMGKENPDQMLDSYYRSVIADSE
jgi:hypothetical protein